MIELLGKSIGISLYGVWLIFNKLRDIVRSEGA
jgi:hypothetical protein